jgi:hypothetical protein
MVVHDWGKVNVPSRLVRACGIAHRTPRDYPIVRWLVVGNKSKEMNSVNT